jgi:hypothetical protein
MFCQDGPATLHPADVLPVKGNQERLEQAVDAFFDEHLEDDFARVAVSRFETEEKCYGRFERRTYVQVNAPQSLAGRAIGPGFARWVSHSHSRNRRPREGRGAVLH